MLRVLVPPSFLFYLGRGYLRGLAAAWSVQEDIRCMILIHTRTKFQADLLDKIDNGEGGILQQQCKQTPSDASEDRSRRDLRKAALFGVRAINILRSITSLSHLPIAPSYLYEYSSFGGNSVTAGGVLYGASGICEEPCWTASSPSTPAFPIFLT